MKISAVLELTGVRANIEGEGGTVDNCSELGFGGR